MFKATELQVCVSRLMMPAVQNLVCSVVCLGQYKPAPLGVRDFESLWKVRQQPDTFPVLDLCWQANCPKSGWWRHVTCLSGVIHMKVDWCLEGTSYCRISEFD